MSNSCRVVKITHLKKKIMNDLIFASNSLKMKKIYIKRFLNKLILLTVLLLAPITSSAEVG